MSDPIGALVDVLKADADTAALAGVHVYGAELPQDMVARLPANAIVVSASGGPSLTGESDAEVDTQRVDLTCYGATPFEAEQLRRVAARAVRGIRRRMIGDTLIHTVSTAGGFSAGRDRDGGWPTAFQSFQLLYAFDGE